MRSRQRFNQGFTLIELMIVVTVVAILFGIAYPSYSNYIVRGNRVDMQARLMHLATNIERYKSQQLSYTGVTLAMVNDGVAVFPVTGTARYNLALNLTPDEDAPTGWNIVATPAAGSSQIGDGAMIIDSQGRRCWNPDSDTTCDVTNAAQAWKSGAR